MLGVRLNTDEEMRLSRFARETGRPKSTLVREWILDRLDREEIDRKIADATALDASERIAVVEHIAGDGTSIWLRGLDAEDGGYDWGPGGPPAAS
jgi:predicted DNA-binding protein